MVASKTKVVIVFMKKSYVAYKPSLSIIGSKIENRKWILFSMLQAFNFVY